MQLGTAREAFVQPATGAGPARRCDVGGALLRAVPAAGAGYQSVGPSATGIHAWSARPTVRDPGSPGPSRAEGHSSVRRRGRRNEEIPAQAAQHDHGEVRGELVAPGPPCRASMLANTRVDPRDRAGSAEARVPSVGRAKRLRDERHIRVIEGVRNPNGPHRELAARHRVPCGAALCSYRSSRHCSSEEKKGGAGRDRGQFDTRGTRAAALTVGGCGRSLGGCLLDGPIARAPMSSVEPPTLRRSRQHCRSLRLHGPARPSARLPVLCRYNRRIEGLKRWRT